MASVLGYCADDGSRACGPATAVSTSHMLGSLWPNLRGRDLRIHPRMDGDRLINPTDPIDTGKGGALVYRWTWAPAASGRPSPDLPAVAGERRTVP